ncbi:MAG: hypothetical protein WC623_24335 [Pedobacter sp.]|uniref:hypothetical protein n=1 Tax=Pedobacter sp. TaxID=1411316 RepID=UPI0035639C78
MAKLTQKLNDIKDIAIELEGIIPADIRYSNLWRKILAISGIISSALYEDSVLIKEIERLKNECMPSARDVER